MFRSEYVSEILKDTSVTECTKRYRDVEENTQRIQRSIGGLYSKIMYAIS